MTVVRGDVSNIDDVSHALKACKALGPVGGTVHAAMGLHEDLFGRMTNEGWQTGVRPKWLGAWNLHNLLNDEAGLEFFLLTSSMTGTVGVATESNYCAANAFLDAFAYWRRKQGKPCISVSLGMVSEVGYLHENPKIEALLLRRGIQPLNEDEFFQVVDLAISDAGCTPGEITATSSHILTGMETLGVRKLLEKGSTVTHTVMDDQRYAILSAALENGQGNMQAGSVDSPLDTVAAPWLEAVPQAAATVLLQVMGSSSLRDAIECVFGRRFPT